MFHGVNLSIVSNKDAKLLTYFLRILWHKIGTKLNFSTSFHPQIGGQIELSTKVLGIF